jgi:hypothetical protein
MLWKGVAMNRRKFLQGSTFATLYYGLQGDLANAELQAKSAEDSTGAGLSEFDRQAFAALPVEKPYDFARVLSRGITWPVRDPLAKPAAQEIALSSAGWTLLIPSSAGIVLRQAAQEFRAYLAQAMEVGVTVQTRNSLANWKDQRRTIVAATRDSLPGCGLELKGPKDYQILVSPDLVVACGFDERGAMYGLYNLEERMGLREAPFLTNGLNTVRHSLYKARMTLSGLGWGEWPDPYLALLARFGFDSIFASVYANPNGVDGPPPFWDAMKTQDPAQMHDLIRRAARFGLDVYCPIVFRYTGDPENTAELRKLVHDIVTSLPEIRGYILLTEGFFYKTWFGANGHNGDLHEWVEGWGEGVTVVVEECKKINPAIEVLPWDYNIDFAPDKVEIKEYVIERLPTYAIPLITFENGEGFILDGESGYLKDYAISRIGPSEVAGAQILTAKKRGMRAVYAKADAWASWQLGTFPYLPFPQQYYARYQALEKYGIDGTMESWSYGFQRSFVGEMRCWYSWSDAPPLDQLLRSIARRDFGPSSDDLVLNAWDHFSQAIRLFPQIHGALGTTAIAAPLYLETPAPGAMPQHGPVKHSWEDPDKVAKKIALKTHPAAVHGTGLVPDFTNQTNMAEHLARPFTVPVFDKYLLLAADKMESGLESYRRAALMAPPSKRRNAFREVLLAEQIERMMRSAEALVEFEDLRFRLASGEDSAAGQALDRMTAILQDEIIRTEAAWETARRDSRLGYEWEQDYFYTPEDLKEKLHLLRLTLNEQLPAFRQRYSKG